MGKVLHRDSEGSRQTEVSQLEKSLSVDQKVLGFQVPVQHLVLVTLLYSIEQLVEEFLRKVT